MDRRLVRPEHGHPSRPTSCAHFVIDTSRNGPGAWTPEPGK
ncbi:glycoside hydrolase family 6 protein [Streptomyces tricolor]|nr:glycoside hydrolase family 6 protein [Streptomyces tricolor]